MFLGWIAELNFIPPNPECGIFLGFPKPLRRDVASQVATHLLHDEHAFAMLTSKQHVNVIMEILGQALGLDISEDKIITQVIEIYKKWLLTDHRPAPIRDDVEHYLIEILKHFSLLFTPRDTGDSLIHAKLCKNALDVIDQLGKDFAAHLSTTTWETVLKIVIGICDHLLIFPEVESPLATALCSHLFRVTMGLWVRSSTQSADMWNIFKILIFKWRHRKPIILQWISTCTSFTQSVLSLLYVYPANTTTVILNSTDVSNDIVQMEQGLVFFYWYRLLHLLGDLDSIESPEIYSEAMSGVHQLAKLFYQLVEFKNPRLLPPEGNSILHIFGPFIFDAINIHRPAYDEGRSEALHTLLQICAHKTSTDYDNNYLAMMYRGIQKGIASSNLMLDIVLRHTATLLSYNFKGIKILIPALWWAIKKSLHVPGLAKLDKLVTPRDVLRSHCYKIASYLLTYANIYGDETFDTLCPSADLFDAPAATKLSELRSLRPILLESLLYESNPQNLTQLINILFHSIWEDTSSVGDFPTQLVETACNPEKRKSWPAQVNATLLQCWIHLAPLYLSFSAANPHFGDKLVTSVCEQLDELFKSKVEATITQDMVILCYRCINEWVMQDQWIISGQGTTGRDRTALYKVLCYVFLGMTGRWSVVPGGAAPDPITNPPNIFPSEEIQNAARHVLVTITNKIDIFPLASDCGSMSSLKTEADILATTNTANRSIGIYILDDRILSVIRHPRDDDGNFISTLFVRDLSGRYCWTGTALFPKYTSMPAMEPPTGLSLLPTPELDPVDFTEAFKFLPEDEKLRHSRLVLRVKSRLDQEFDVLSKVSYYYNTPTAEIPPSLPPVVPEQDTTASRLLLSHLGWNNPNYRSRFFFVKDIPNGTEGLEELRTLWSEIDNIAERWRFTVGIVYVPGEFPTEADIFGAANPPSDFLDVVKALGTQVNLSTHHGFTGGLHPQVTGSDMLYFANSDMELVYHVAPNMPYLALTAQQYKHRLILEDKVIVAWTQHSDSIKNFDFIKDLTAHSLIIIHQLSGQLFRVKLMKRNDPQQPQAQATSVCGYSGPLTEELIVSKHVLAPLLRQTVIGILSAHSHSDRPIVARQRAINEFIKKFKNERVTTQMYYSQQFT